MGGYEASGSSRCLLWWEVESHLERQGVGWWGGFGRWGVVSRSGSIHGQYWWWGSSGHIRLWVLGLRSQVIAYGQSGFPCMDWGEFRQEFEVTECGSARSIHSDQVLIELMNFNDQTSLVPFG